MDEDNTLDFLETPVEQPVVEEQKIEQVAEGAKTPEVKVEGAEAQPEINAETGDVKGEVKTVPLAVALDWRDRMKTAEAALKTKEPAPKEEATFVIPDPAKDPAGFAHYNQQVVTLNIMNERMNNSERHAVKTHGKELVDKARDWSLARMDNDPAYAETIVSSTDPYNDAIEAYNEHLEYEEFRAAKKAGKETVVEEASRNEKGQFVAAETAPAVVAKPPQPAARKPSGTIANRTSAGSGAGDIPAGDGNAFDSLFGSKDQ